MCALSKLELILYVLCMLINGIFVILNTKVSGGLEESSLTFGYALHILTVKKNVKPHSGFTSYMLNI